LKNTNSIATFIAGSSSDKRQKTGGKQDQQHTQRHFAAATIQFFKVAISVFRKEDKAHPSG